ncbi:MAG: AAA family ATPase [Desulfobacteraceae bacterium]|nr:AAA family ATPase [Desulfobacteraceae bacterium]
MALTFQKLSRNSYLPGQGRNIAYLQPDNWDDYGHKTLFSLTVFDEQGNQLEIGNVKIGFVGQNEGWTEEQMPQQFGLLSGNFFSLGQDADYYQNIVESLSQEMAVNVLTALGDVAHDANRFQLVENEGAFNTSLLRTVNRTSIEHQFRRILQGDAPLTDFNFIYEKSANHRYSGINVEFTVTPNTKPSSNIHILIGRNGVGKTTLINNMVDALLPGRGEVEETGYFSNRFGLGNNTPLHDNYFAGVVSVSFSAFDPFEHPEDQTDPRAGMCYHYVGLRKYQIQNGERIKLLKNDNELIKDFTDSLKVCFALTAKRNRWINAVIKLESDFNFAEMDLHQLIDDYSEDISEDKSLFSSKAAALFFRMSSGHKIVLLTITKLVETVVEKTLLLLDEPESHLHPPLLSAFTRALSDLLENRNGVAIVATHSPVVLQEVPKSCVSILRRTRLEANVDRPENETFAENVGVLTREVFGLEVSKSGFHDLLSASVERGKSYEEIEQEYQYQLGFEGRAILRSLIAIRDSQAGANQ